MGEISFKENELYQEIELFVDGEKIGEAEVEKLKANKKSLEERNAKVEKENDNLRKQIEQLESFMQSWMPQSRNRLKC